MDSAVATIHSRGLVFPEDRRILSPKHRRLLRRNLYEAKETRAALRTIRADDRVLELGAGIGYMSALIMKHRGPAAYTAYEANPRLIEYIAAVHAANAIEGVTVHNAVLGAGEGEETFYLRSNFLASSLSPGPSGEAEGVIGTARVRRRALAGALAEAAATALICDIEGGEADLLPGADLSGLRLAIIELHPQITGAAGMRAVFEACLGAGLCYHPRASHAKVVTFLRDL